MRTIIAYFTQYARCKIMNNSFHFQVFCKKYSVERHKTHNQKTWRSEDLSHPCRPSESSTFSHSPTSESTLTLVPS